MSEISIPKITDFKSAGAKARKMGQLLMVLVSQEDCPYCHLIKEEIIRPMLLGGDFRAEIVIGEMFIDEGEQVRDFEGKLVEGAAFAHNYDVFLTPTLLFLDGHGEQMADKMVGINTVEMYYYYVDQSIRQALTRMQGKMQ